MKMRPYLITGILVLVCNVVFVVSIADAQKKVPDTVMLKLEKASMPPVTFSHPVHVQKAKMSVPFVTIRIRT